MLTATKENTLANDILLVVSLLMGIGTVFVFSASANVSQELDLHRFYDFQSLRQILFFPVALLVMYAASRVDYRRLSFGKGWFRSPTSYLLGVSIVLLILVLIPGFGREINQARRWLRIPVGSVSVSFQPSELAKWAVLIFLAAFCEKVGDGLGSYWKGFVPACVVIAGVVGLILIEDFGTAALVAFLGLLMLLMGGARWWHVLSLLPFGGVGFCMALLGSPTRWRRIAAFLRPQEWAGTAAYQANQSLIALGSGGLWGKGLGRGICKYGHLPEDTTDFIFAVIGEELGFVGTGAVIGLFIILVWLGVVVVVRCRDRFGQLLAAGIVLAIGVQAAVNIGVVTVVLPTKGIPLPFVSAGGTSMLLSAVAIGVLLNIAKQSPKVPKEARE